MADAFGERLKKLREQRGMSQQLIADLCGLHRNTISVYESGDVSPSIEHLMLICDALNVSSDYILGIGEDKRI